MHENPYKFTGPLGLVIDRLVCIQRNEETNTIINSLNKGECWVVIGPTQIGKTTFLHQVAYKNASAYSIYLDLNDSPSDIDTFCNWLTMKLLEKVPHDSKILEQTSSLVQHQDSYSTFIDFFKGFKTNDDKRITLFLDGIEKISKLDKFLNLWRVIQKDMAINRYSIIMTGSFILHEQVVEFNRLFNTLQILYLKDFSYEQSRQLIEEPFKLLGISIEENAKTKLIEHLNGHPQMLQQCCHFLVDRAFEKQDILTEKDADAALFYVLKKNQVFAALEHEINNSQLLHDFIKLLLTKKIVEYSSPKVFSYACSSAIIVGPEACCTIRNRLFEDFLKELLEKKNQEIFPGEELIRQPSGVEFLDNDNKEPMPYAIKQIQVRDYHGIHEIGIKLPVDTRWIFLTGENAFGKTAFLRAITVGLFGSRDLNRFLLSEENKSKIAVEIYDKGKNWLNIVGDQNFRPFRYFVAYGPSRLEIQSDRGTNEIIGRSAKTYSIFYSDGVSLNIERELLIWGLKKDSRFEIVKRILLTLLPHGADIDLDKPKKGIVYTEKENDEDGGANFEPIPFEKLAAGNKSIIALVGDLLIRFYKEYEMDGKTDIDPMDFEGIVSIDELDLHLHPKWMRKLPRLLSDLFPKIQFIAATHSEIPILGAPKDSVFLKVTRTREKGIRVHRLPIDIKNLLSHHILTSDFFDLEECTQEGNERLADVRTEDSYREILEMDAITQKLKDFEKSDHDYPGNTKKDKNGAS